MGPVAMNLVFWMLNFKPTFSVSSFTSIERLFSSSSLFAIRVVSSVYLKLLIFLLAILIPACASSRFTCYQINILSKSTLKKSCFTSGYALVILTGKKCIILYIIFSLFWDVCIPVKLGIIWLKTFTSSEVPSFLPLFFHPTHNYWSFSICHSLCRC